MGILIRFLLLVSFSLIPFFVHGPAIAGEGHEKADTHHEKDKAKDTHKAKAHEKPHWGYEGKQGAERWAELSPEYATCKEGKQQSPIDIRVAAKGDLEPIQFNYQPVPFKIIDNGHTVQVNYAPGSGITIGKKTYELLQFHFHKPSENLISGRAFDMEGHLVHADKDGKLAVVAVFIKPGVLNDFVETLWKHLPEEAGYEVKVAGIKINAQDLLPETQAYYSFRGSLTTPPCSEGVSWYALLTPIELSQKQLDRFAKLYSMNARPAQPLNDRVIQRSE